MGTASTTKVLKNVAGALTEETTLTTSAGASDANKVPALNASGVLDATIVNSKTTSAGAGDSGKVAALNASGILDSTIINSKTTSAGAGDSGKVVALNASGLVDDTIINATVTSAANKVVKLDGSGKLDSTVMPVGIGADTAIVVASEALVAGDFVNIWNSAGAFKVRKADASVAGKHAMGFVLAAVASAGNATVYFEGTNTQVTGQTPGDVFLQTTAGIGGATVPSASGNVVQRIGFAVSATAVNFQSGRSITLA